MMSEYIHVHVHVHVLIIFVTLLSAVIGNKPNILFILADDYGWNDVGFHGSEILTPNLDKLAKTGVILNNYYVQPICTPSRSQLLSGRYQIHTGLQHAIIWPAMPNCLPTSIPTLADLLRKQNYATHVVGKWHLGFYKKKCLPTHRGFDSFYGYLTGSENYYTHRRGSTINDHGKKVYIEGLDFHYNTKPVIDQNGTYSLDAFVTQVEKLVYQHATYNNRQPLFMYLPFQSVHSPLQVPAKFEKKYSFIQNEARRRYAGMVSAMDEGVGKVVDAYQQAGLWNNTILVFSTDNGGQVLSGGNNWPLRGWKAQLWEGGVRGVGFVHSVILNEHGRIYDGLVHISDWLPTLVGVAGGSTTGLKLDGVNMWKAISEDNESPRKELLHNIDPLYPTKGIQRPNSPFDNRIRAAIRVGDWKLLTGDPGSGGWIPPPHLSQQKQTPFTVSTNQNIWLFNIATDPLEKHDLSSQYPQIVDNLLGRLAMHNATAVPVVYPEDDPEANPSLHNDVWGPWQ